MKTSFQHFQAGLAHYRAGDLDASIPEYREALRLKPDFREAHHNLTLVYSEQGRFEEWVVEYQAALRLNPNDPEYRNSLGVTFAKLGRNEEAVGKYLDADVGVVEVVDARVHRRFDARRDLVLVRPPHWGCCSPNLGRPSSSSQN
jgi:hypothetical protein